MVAQPELQPATSVFPFNQRQLMQPMHQRASTYPPFEQQEAAVSRSAGHVLMPCNLVPAPPPAYEPAYPLPPYMEGAYAPPAPTRGYVLNGVKRLHISRESHPSASLSHSFFHQYEHTVPPKARNNAPYKIDYLSD